MEGVIDTDLYSRQIFALGLDTLVALSKLNVLVVGLDGLGVEVAKNLVLAGPRSVTLWDDAPCALADLSSQFFLSEDDVKAGLSRGQASLARVAELNPYVRVSLHRGGSSEVEEVFLGQFQVIVACNCGGALAARLDAHCHAAGKGFIRG